METIAQSSFRPFQSCKRQTYELKYGYTGDSGFGEIVAKKLDKLGYGVFAGEVDSLEGRRTGSSVDRSCILVGVYLEASIERLKSEGTERMIPLRVDVSNEESVERVAKQIGEILQEKKGQLVGLVNNAGILVQPGPVEWTPSDAYRRMFNVNVMGTVMTTKSRKSLRQVKSTKTLWLNVLLHSLALHSCFKGTYRERSLYR